MVSTICADGLGRERADARHRAQLDPRAELGELAALRGVELRAREVFGRVGERRPARRGANAFDDRVVLGRAHVPGGEDRVVLAHEREHLLGLGEELVVVVGHDDARARESRAARRRRSRSPGGCSASAATRCARRGRARPRPRPGSPRRPRGRSRSRRTPRSRRRPRAARPTRATRWGSRATSARSARWPAAAASRGGLERVDGALAVRVGTEVAVQIGRSGQVDAHQCRAYFGAT